MKLSDNLDLPAKSPGDPLSAGTIAGAADTSVRATEKHPAVFFDRDGTLMEEVHYCADPALVRVFPGVSDALRELKQAGYRTILITNQSGIGRGHFTEAQYRAVEAEFLRQVGEGLLDASYFCPDAPDVPSTRRKPEPGMVLEAARDFDLDLSRSFFIGDKSADIECGRRAGTRTILVRTGYGSAQSCNPEYVAADIGRAVRFVLEKGPKNIDFEV